MRHKSNAAKPKLSPTGRCGDLYQMYFDLNLVKQEGNEGLDQTTVQLNVQTEIKRTLNT